MSKKIVIKLSESGRVRKVYSDVPFEIASAAVKNVSERFGKIKLSRKTKFKLHLKTISKRLLFVLNAIRLACKRDFYEEDINRHQYSEV